MPFLSVQTSQMIGDYLARDFLKTASSLVAEHLEKPESLVMTSFQHPAAMTLGNSDAECAIIELTVLDLNKKKVPDLYDALHALAMKHLNLPGDRIFITFHDVPRGRWGWNGERF